MFVLILLLGLYSWVGWGESPEPYLHEKSFLSHLDGSKQESNDHPTLRDSQNDFGREDLKLRFDELVTSLRGHHNCKTQIVRQQSFGLFKAKADAASNALSLSSPWLHTFPLGFAALEDFCLSLSRKSAVMHEDKWHFSALRELHAISNKPQADCAQWIL